MLCPISGIDLGQSPLYKPLVDAIAKRFSPFPSALIARTILTHQRGITEAAEQVAYGLSMAYHDATAALTSKDYCDKLWQDALALAGAGDAATRSGAKSEGARPSPQPTARNESGEEMDLFIYKQRRRTEGCWASENSLAHVPVTPPARPFNPTAPASVVGLPAVESPSHLAAALVPESSHKMSGVRSRRTATKLRAAARSRLRRAQPPQAASVHHPCTPNAIALVVTARVTMRQRTPAHVTRPSAAMRPPVLHGLARPMPARRELASRPRRNVPLPVSPRGAHLRPPPPPWAEMCGHRITLRVSTALACSPTRQRKRD